MLAGILPTLPFSTAAHNSLTNCADGPSAPSSSPLLARLAAGSSLPWAGEARFAPRAGPVSPESSEKWVAAVTKLSLLLAALGGGSAAAAGARRTRERSSWAGALLARRIPGPGTLAGAAGAGNFSAGSANFGQFSAGKREGWLTFCCLLILRARELGGGRFLGLNFRSESGKLVIRPPGVVGSVPSKAKLAAVEAEGGLLNCPKAGRRCQLHSSTGPVGPAGIILELQLPENSTDPMGQISRWIIGNG